MAFADINLNSLQTSFECDKTSTLPKPVSFIGTHEIVKFIGGGTYGKVYLTKNRVTGVKAAVKVIKKSALSFMTIDAAVEEKAALLSLRDSPWFTHLEASWHDDANFYLETVRLPPLFAISLTNHKLNVDVLPYASGRGDLASWRGA